MILVPMIIAMLMVLGLLITVGSSERPLPVRPAIARSPGLGGSGFAPGDDVIAAVHQDSWTELDDRQLRRLLDS